MIYGGFYFIFCCWKITPPNNDKSSILSLKISPILSPPFSSREAHHVFDHRTSRLCDDPECRGVLNDSIINFGESLPQNEVKKAFDHAEKVCVLMMDLYVHVCMCVRVCIRVYACGCM